MTASDQTLDRSLVQGIAWLGALKWLTQLLSWGVTLTVAHLLTPADYGLFGMAMVYIGLIQFVGEAGILAAIIKPRELDDELVANLGGFAVMVGIGLTSLSMGTAGLIAWFFHDAAVAPLITVLSATFVLRGLQALPRGLLVRELAFRRVAWIDTVETLALTFSTLGCALLGWRSWALVWGVFVGALASTVYCYRWRPHRLAFPRRLSTIASALTLGMHVLTAQVAWYIYSNADFVIIGRMLGRTALGAYTFAWTLASVAVERVSSLVVRVTPPIFSAVQDDRPALQRYICTLTEGLALVTMPVCIGLSLVADVLVAALLGPTWTGTVMPLRLLALYAAFRCITVFLPQVLTFTGHSRRTMQFSLLAALVLPGLFAVGTRWGTAGVAWVWVIVYPVLMLSTFVRYALHVIDLSARRYLASLWPATSGTLAMTAVVLALRHVAPATLPALARLGIYVVGGALTYAGMTFALHGRRLRTLWALLRGVRQVEPAPVYVSGTPTARPRLLLISCHFPPDPAIGSLRWQKFSRYAALRGWELDVIMRDPSELTSRDPARLAELPPGTRVYGVRTRPLGIERWENRAARFWRRFRPARVQATSRARADVRPPRSGRDLLRAYFTGVDYLRGRRWVGDAARLGTMLARRGTHRAIISSGPPHFAHEAARRVASGVSLPFVMDMRDPWSLAHRLPEAMASPLAIELARREERRTVSEAGMVVVNTEPLCDEMRRLHPTTNARILAVPNGFDDDPLPPPQRAHRFVIAYAGTIYLDRDPRALFEATARVIRRLELTPRDFGLEFMGDVRSYEGMPLERLARDAGIEEFVRLHPVRPRQEALAFLASAAMLVQLPQDSDLVIPGKLYEYMRFDAWLLVMANPGNASERLLAGFDADVVAPNDSAAMAEVIARRYAQHRRGERGQPLARHEEFSRRARATTFFDALERMTGAPDAIPRGVPGGIPGGKSAGRPVERSDADVALVAISSSPAPEPAPRFEQSRPGVSPAPDLRVILGTHAQEIPQHSQA